MELIGRKSLPQGLLGQAIDDTLKRWEALAHFVDDGRLEIDNTLIENAIRPSALGRKTPENPSCFQGGGEANLAIELIHKLGVRQIGPHRLSFCWPA
jgi:hypothetical protein